MLTDIIVNNKYVLIYDGLELKSGTLTTGQVTSPYIVETYDTAQEIVDRGLALGLTCDTEYIITAMEHGIILPQENMDDLIAGIPYMDVGHQIRMIALGLMAEEDFPASPPEE